MINKPTFTSRLLYRLTNWEIFENYIKGILLPLERWENAATTLKATTSLTTRMNEEIRILVPWSKPSTKSKRWWALELTDLKTQLFNAKRMTKQDNSHHHSKEEQKGIANKWTTEIHKAQWKHSEETFKNMNRGNIHKVMKAPGKPRGKTGIPDIQGISTFQKKCGILRETYFPANVITLLPIQPKWLPSEP